MTPCFELLPKNVLKLTHTHDMLSRVKEEIGAYGVDTQGRECTQEEERHALLRGDVIIALQENEARLFKELVPEREVIILGYSPWHIVPQPSNKVIPNRILNLGGDNVLNRRGLTLFCSNVWPRVLQSVPEAQFRVVGPVGTSLPPDTPNAKALGRLESVEEEYAKASIVVNPVDLGTGLKIKSVEALCYGKALVSTINGVEGMSLNNQQHCLIAKNWNDFSDKVISLLKDDKLRNRIEHEAVLYAKNHFTEEVVYAELKKCLEKSGNIK